MIEIWTESTRLNKTSQKLADQTKKNLKRGWSSDLEILEIFEQINSEEYELDLPTRIETQHTEKSPNRIEEQNTGNRKAADPSTTKQTLMQEDNINVQLIKKIMAETKTTLPSLRNQNWQRVMVEPEKVNKLLPNIPTENITELNELIHARVKLVYDKIDAPLRNPNRNTKFRMEN